MLNRPGEDAGTSGGDEALLRILLPVQRQFLRSLEDHLEAFERLREAHAGTASGALLADLASRAHKIVGVAETLGYVRLGRLAARAEIALTQEGHSEGTVVLITKLVLCIRRILARTAAG